MKMGVLPLLSLPLLCAVVGYSKRTVDKRLKYLADQSAKAHDEAIAEKKFETSCVQVDEMETYEHTRCKPLFIAMAVRHKTGEILGMEVAKMPVKGLLAKVGKTKYKWTSDERERAFKKLMRRISPCIKPTITFKSDSHKRYTGWITDIFPHAMHEKHKRVKTPKGSPKPFDPLFKVNNTCAKMRNDIARLARKKWVTTKSEGSLQNHLWLYIAWTNGYQVK